LAVGKGGFEEVLIHLLTKDYFSGNPMIVTIFLILASTIKQEPPTDSIYWCPERPLVWKDFTVIPDPRGAAAPSTIVFKHFEVKNGYLIEVRSVFLCRKSIANPDDTVQQVLFHERRHFDITEIVARRMRKYLSEITITQTNIQSVYNKLGEMGKEIKIMNAKYDSETDHSRVYEAQLKWNDYIASELKGLEKYAVDCKQFGP
jgi:hypothetical protein